MQTSKTTFLAGVFRFGMRENAVPGWLIGAKNKRKPGDNYEAAPARDRERE